MIKGILNAGETANRLNIAAARREPCLKGQVLKADVRVKERIQRYVPILPHNGIKADCTDFFTLL